jgi:hypothetical protein
MAQKLFLSDEKCEFQVRPDPLVLPVLVYILHYERITISILVKMYIRESLY